MKLLAPDKNTLSTALHDNIQLQHPYALYYLQQTTPIGSPWLNEPDEAAEYTAYILSPYIVRADSDWQDSGLLVFRPCKSILSAETMVFSFCKQRNWNPLLWNGIEPIAQQIWQVLQKS
ncbi:MULTISPECIES: hypothetical protein [Snodgrassella]|uniref:Uncharacterized protein n=1 Tax=Snodgrassella alvi TaxID=1196083 RepID=A0A2N9X7X6_9NEIS|nr:MULTISPECIES: hypothetical protein [Snodgrassella]MCT6881078.1 hypothetical protein [Snodgrassella alvi]MCX8747467.1 hypothetical protein [Snodgrassella sp. B3800]MCX8749429.1 hypothetical protein [Snodgrassella sp. B3088]MCX8753190.1 hypothetical protein [Snodgrassella sp. B3837]PIT39295.1 hypothetical protein BHC43_03490 [Snodgrassella alvi]